MSDVINIHYHNSTYIKVSCENQGIIAELSDFFTFEVEGAKFSPSFRNHLWDGKQRLYSKVTGGIYAGLLQHVIKFAEDRKYQYTIDEKLFKTIEKNHEFNAQDFIKSLNIQKIIPHDYQISAIDHMIKNKRCLCLSPTSSGKAFLIYCLIRWYLQNTAGKILIIVPLIDLTAQLLQEFKEYSDYDIEKDIHIIHGGLEKTSDKRVIISTWQSIYKMPRKYFLQFDAAIFDEIHETGCGKSKTILEKCINTSYKVGLTGTIKNTKLNQLVLEGITGPLLKVITTKKLMEDGKVSQLKIKSIILKYPETIRKANKNLTYHEEQEFIRNYTTRNKLIAKLAIGIRDENVLILSKSLEHIEFIRKELENCGKTVFVIIGETDTDIRLKNKLETESLTNVVILATERIFSTGISIKNLQNLIMVSGGKSSTRILQSIGRILRLDGKLNKCTLYDFVDDFSYNKKRNYLLKHFLERVSIYNSEGFEFTLNNINM
jgi:superfamily II DNA or RNA helicase